MGTSLVSFPNKLFSVRLSLFFFLRQTSLVFSVGETEVPNFRMVERHYFRNQVGIRRFTVDNTPSVLSKILALILSSNRGVS